MADDITTQAAQAATDGQPQAGVDTPRAGTTTAQAAGSDAQAAPETISLEEAKKLRAEAASLRRRLKELEDLKKQMDDAKLSETERLQKRLAELEKEQALHLRERQERTLRYETMLAASKLGIVDPEAAYKLLDLKAIEFDEDGTPKDIQKHLEELLKQRPYLKPQAQPQAPTVSPTNPAVGSNRTNTFTQSQIADRRFWEQHRDEILKAMAEGRIVPG